MIVVADTSPINYLARTGYLWILPQLFGRVLLPNAVMAEMLHPQAPPEVRALAADPPSWLEVLAVSNLAVGLPPSLGEGECEAISLALEIGADVLLIDDFAGRKEAQSRRIAARGTLAVLLQASLREHLDFPTTLERLKQLGFRVSPALEKSLLAISKSGKDR
jgi:predicted nucleic acid-binding protein